MYLIFFDDFDLSMYTDVMSFEEISFDLILITNSLRVRSIKLVIILSLSELQNNPYYLLENF